MKKLIDIPDEIILDLKKSASDNKRSLKNYIEFIIWKYHDKNDTNELAERSLIDGQVFRPFVLYFEETFEAIKGKEFTFDEVTFNTKIEFLKHVKNVCDWIIKQEKDAK